MKSFQDIQRYLTQAKDKVTSTVKSAWDSYWVQGTIQGLAAPYYSYNSLISTWDESEDVRTAVSRAFETNGKYALEALLSYFIYYRMIHPTLDEASASYDSGSVGAGMMQFGITALDYLLFFAMELRLHSVWSQNLVQNFAHTSNITYAATKAMPESKDFKPCECSQAQIKRADGESFLFYAGNRIIVNKLSDIITKKFPGVTGLAASFALEAASFGWPLVEYKLSAVGMCTEHRYKEILDNKAYCFMYGGSFVTATWTANKILNKITGAESPYIYDAVFSLMFQLYALVSIARKDALPGVHTESIDLFAAVKYLAETRGGQYLLKKLLGDLYSLEKMVQTPGVSFALTMRDDEIKDSIKSVRGGLKKVKSSRLFSMAKWVNKVFPFIPPEVKNLLKTVGKDTITSLIVKIEKLLELARNAEEKRKDNQKKVVIFNRAHDQYFGREENPEEKKLEQKIQQDNEIIRVEDYWRKHIKNLRTIEGGTNSHLWQEIQARGRQLEEEQKNGVASISQAEESDSDNESEDNNRHSVPELKPAFTPLLPIDEINPNPPVSPLVPQQSVPLVAEIKQDKEDKEIKENKDSMRDQNKNLLEVTPTIENKDINLTLNVIPQTEQIKKEQSPLKEPAAPIIDDNYFRVYPPPISPLVKVDEVVTKPRDSLTNNHSSLFHKKKTPLQIEDSLLLQRRKKDRSLAALTALIVSNSARTKRNTFSK